MHILKLNTMKTRILEKTAPIFSHHLISILVQISDEIFDKGAVIT